MIIIHVTFAVAGLVRKICNTAPTAFVLLKNDFPNRIVRYGNYMTFVLLVQKQLIYIQRLFSVSYDFFYLTLSSFDFVVLNSVRQLL